MTSEPHQPVTATEVWLQWAAEHGVRYEDTGQPFDTVARDYYETSDALSELFSPDSGDGTLTASQRLPINVAYARALLIEAVIVRRGGVLDPYVDPIQITGPDGRLVPPHAGPEHGPRWETTSPPGAGHDLGPQPQDVPAVARGVRR